MTSDPADNCSLYVVCSRDSANKRPALSAKFQFDDYIRCVSARQLLLRSKDNLRLAKMTRITKMLHLPLPEASPTSSVAALPQPQTEAHHNLGIISVSPTPRMLDQSPLATDQPASRGVSSSMLNTVFVPPAATPHIPQEFEMSNFELTQLHSLAEADAPPTIFNSSVKLAPPTDDYSSESSSSVSLRDSLDSSLTNINIGADSFMVSYKSQTPETLIEQSCGSHNTEQQLSELSTSTERLPTPSQQVSSGYKVQPLGEEEDRNDTPLAVYDSSMAEEDRGACADDVHVASNDDEDGYRDHHGRIPSLLIDSNSSLMTDSERSQFLMSVEQDMHPLHDSEDAPGQLSGNRTHQNNGSVPTATHHFPNASTVNKEGDIPVNWRQFPASVHLGPANQELPVSNNIVWDIPLIEEITEQSRTGVVTRETRHRSHN